MKSLAIDLDSGKISRWMGDQLAFAGISDTYGDVYTLRVHLYRGGGSVVSTASIQLLVKRTQRRDATALWKLTTFNRLPAFARKDSNTYVGQVNVTGSAYRDALKLDAHPGNDIQKADFVGILRVVTASEIVEAEFNYELLNSVYRVSDGNFAGVSSNQ